VRRGSRLFVHALGSCLDDHDTEGVRHDVVELASDTRPLFRDGESRRVVPLPLELPCALSELRGDEIAGPNDPSGDPEAGEDHGYEDEVVARVVRPEIDCHHEKSQADERTAQIGVSRDRIRRDDPREELCVDGVRRRFEGNLHD
jgi:hypothetical protein